MPSDVLHVVYVIAYGAVIRREYQTTRLFLDDDENRSRPRDNQPRPRTDIPWLNFDENVDKYSRIERIEILRLLIRERTRFKG